MNDATRAAVTGLVEASLSATAARSDFDVVVLVGSAGSLRASRMVLAGLPANFPIALILARHRYRPCPESVVDLLQPYSALPVTHVVAGEHAEPGGAQVVPSGFDLRLDEDGLFILTPAAIPFVALDQLLTSIAARHGRRAIAVVLSGAGSDGSAGAKAVRNAGGTVIVQDQPSSLIWGMGAATVRNGAADFVLPLQAISHAIAALVKAAPTPPAGGRNDDHPQIDAAPAASTPALR